MEDKNKKLAIDVMMQYIDEDDIRGKTKNDLCINYGFAEKEAESYADKAYAWWESAYE